MISEIFFTGVFIKTDSDKTGHCIPCKLQRFFSVFLYQISLFVITQIK